LPAVSPDACAYARLSGSPADYGLAFSAPKHLSCSSWAPCRGIAPFRWLHPLRSFPPRVSPYASTPVALRRPPILSWVFRPLEPSPSTPWILCPARARRLEHPRRLPAPPSRVHEPEGPLPRSIDTARRRGRRNGPCGPSRRVRLPRDTICLRPRSRAHHFPSRSRRRLPAPFGTGPRHPSVATPTSLTFAFAEQAQQPLAFEALKYVESGVSPERAPALLDFLAYAPTS